VYREIFDLIRSVFDVRKERASTCNDSTPSTIDRLENDVKVASENGENMIKLIAE